MQELFCFRDIYFLIVFYGLTIKMKQSIKQNIVRG